MGMYLPLDKSARGALPLPEQPDRPTNEVRSLDALLGPLPVEIRPTADEVDELANAAAKAGKAFCVVESVTDLCECSPEDIGKFMTKLHRAKGERLANTLVPDPRPGHQGDQTRRCVANGRFLVTLRSPAARVTVTRHVISRQGTIEKNVPIVRLLF